MNLAQIEKRLEKVGTGATVSDPEALACWLEAGDQLEIREVEAKYGEALAAAYAKPPGARLTDAEDEGVAMIWRALWIAAHRLAEEREISIWVVNRAQYEHSKLKRET